MLSYLENPAVATRLEINPGSILISIPKKGSTKECLNHWKIAAISHASKVMLKILQLGFSIAWTKNIQMFKLDL